MKKEELIEKLKLLQGSGDQEYQHRKADELLIDFIDDEDIENEYEEINKWYA